MVVHLAGISQVAECERDPQQARRVNVEYPRLLLEHLVETNSGTHFIFASTSQVYGAGVELTETSAIAPLNLYAETKCEAEEVVREFAGRNGLSATILRFFNHTHKTQPPSFFLPHVYRQLLSLREARGLHRIPVGNLEVARDIGSVRDLVRALLAVIQKASWELETFNVCSGQPKRLRTLASGLAARLEVDVEFVVDPSRVRANDPPVISGSPAKLTARTGWKPQVRSEQELIDDFLAD